MNTMITDMSLIHVTRRCVATRGHDHVQALKLTETRRPSPAYGLTKCFKNAGKARSMRGCGCTFLL